MTPFRRSYERLPDAAKDAVMTILREALRMRSRDTMIPDRVGASALRAMEEIADIFAAHGMEIEEYT